MVGALIVNALMCIGFINFHEETDGLAMWLPEDAPYRVNTEWLRDTYPSSNRFQSILIIAKDGGNILKAEHVKVGESVLRQ